VQQPRKLGREQVPPKRFKDYKVYSTAKEEDNFILTTCTDNAVMAADKNNNKALETVAHYIVMHYKEKEKLKKRKNI
jgi:hypothetical protein